MKSSSDLRLPEWVPAPCDLRLRRDTVPRWTDTDRPQSLIRVDNTLNDDPASRDALLTLWAARRSVTAAHRFPVPRIVDTNPQPIFRREETRRRILARQIPKVTRLRIEAARRLESPWVSLDTLALDPDPEHRAPRVARLSILITTELAAEGSGDAAGDASTLRYDIDRAYRSAAGETKGMESAQMIFREDAEPAYPAIAEEIIHGWGSTSGAGESFANVERKARDLARMRIEGSGAACAHALIDALIRERDVLPIAPDGSEVQITWDRAQIVVKIGETTVSRRLPPRRAQASQAERRA